MTKRSQINFTPTSELRQVIEEEAKRKGLAVSSFIRTKLLDVFKEQIEQLKQPRESKRR